MIFVAGLPRSGTSLVHFLIGAHPRCVALGEVWGLISSAREIARASEVHCSCINGKTPLPMCPFWGPLLPVLRGDGDYSPVLARVREVYGDRILVDSSKNLAVAQRGAKILYVIRDVRAWATSTDRASIRGFLGWHRSNVSRIQALEDREWLLVSYDELSLAPMPSMRRICEFLELPFTEDLFEFGRGAHHAVKCNYAMKSNPRRMAGIEYDNRWFRSTDWQVPSLLLPHVMKFNREHVYGLVDTAF